MFLLGEDWRSLATEGAVVGDSVPLCDFWSGESVLILEWEWDTWGSVVGGSD